MKKNIILLIVVFILTTFVIGCSPTNDKIDNGDMEIIPEDTNDNEDEPAPEEEAMAENNNGDIAVGQPAPDLIFKNKDGEEVALMNLKGEEVSLEDYRGKIIFLNFWATWCVYCDMEMPDLQKLNNENDDLVVIAVDVAESKDVVEKYINKGNYDFEVALDEEGEVAVKYLVSAFPTTYIIDKEGILLGGRPGMMTYDQMVEILEAVRESEE